MTQSSSVVFVYWFKSPRAQVSGNPKGLASGVALQSPSLQLVLHDLNQQMLVSDKLKEKWVRIAIMIIIT